MGKSIIILVSIIILSLSICFLGINIKEYCKHNRYEIIMSSGEVAGLVTLKYDRYTGRTWRLGFPDNHWVEIKDYGWLYPEPSKEK